MLPITFLSDYGYEDEFVGTCHAVIQQLAPGAGVIDLSHGIPRHDVRAGALVLRNALHYLPQGVCLAVVDPGVGTSRRPLAVRCMDGRHFVGPDNGLLWPAMERCGGVDAAVDITLTPYRVEPVSSTFHGRDLFAPVAAYLAREKPVEDAGAPVRPGDVTRLEFPLPLIAPERVVATVLTVDRFGNLQLNLGLASLWDAGFAPGRPLSVSVSGERRRAVCGRTFADVSRGEAVVYEDSTFAAAIALNGASAAGALTAAPGSEVVLEPWTG